MPYKINLPLVGSTGTRKKVVIDENNDLFIDVSRVGSFVQISSFPGSRSGYTSGGNTATTGSTVTNTIDKFPFSTNANATDVGDLTVARGDIHSGQSSTENGYSSGGLIGPPLVTQNVIDKFSFASDANATDVGNTTAAKQDVSGQSSIDNGYSSGGGTGNAPAPILNIIENFPFSSDANATDVGDLTASRRDTTGQQV